MFLSNNLIFRVNCLLSLFFLCRRSRSTGDFSEYFTGFKVILAILWDFLVKLFIRFPFIGFEAFAESILWLYGKSIFFQGRIYTLNIIRPFCTRPEHRRSLIILLRTKEPSQNEVITFLLLYSR